MDHEYCWACGYALAIHILAGWIGRDGDPDPNGGCPADEVEAMRRMGLL